MVLEFIGRPRTRAPERHATSRTPPSPTSCGSTAPRSVEVLQEREYVRIRSARPVLVYGGPNQEQVQSYTVDVSGGGFLLAGPDALKIGEEIQFQLDADTGRAADQRHRPSRARSTGKGVARSSSTSITDLDRRRLVRFIFECQRAERRRGLAEGVTWPMPQPTP